MPEQGQEHPEFEDVVEIEGQPEQVLRDLRSGILSEDVRIALLDFMDNASIEDKQKVAQDLVPEVFEERDAAAAQAQQIQIDSLRAKGEQNIAFGELQEKAGTDSLTGIANDATYDEALHNRELRGKSIIRLDLDKFKEVNDAFGHRMAGNEVLREVTRRVKAALLVLNLQERDFFRVGGDEFAIIVPTDRAEETMQAIRQVVNLYIYEIPGGRHSDSDGIERAVTHADKSPQEFIEQVRNSREVGEIRYAGPVTVSLGAAAIESDATWADHLADLAAQEDKRSRNAER